MTRQLVSIRRIDDLYPIPGADRIEEARVDGWSTIVQKGKFAPGDHVVYFEIDSMLPVKDPRFSFLADRGTKDLPDGTPAHRLKTIRMRGVVSQGLVVHPDEFNVDEWVAIDNDQGAEALGVTLYEDR